MGYNSHEIEKKWQKTWDESKIFEPEPDERKKFFITIPYPYLNGNLHAGHTRTFTIGDVVARYKRMLGYNVLFPMAFHATGTPLVGLAELIQKRDPEIMKVYNEYHDISMDVLETLTTPEILVEYFSREAEAAMRSIGYAIDWRRKFTTTDLPYKKFITWQYNLLREKDLVGKGSHPVRWCPNDQNPVEDHDILRGEDATIMDYALIKFRLNEGILPCATLRPETVFGVTNLWVNPEVTHVKIRVKDSLKEENWIVSREACEKLRYAGKKVEIVGEVKGTALIGKRVKNLVTGSEVLILPASFVKPENGSGIVMSVPAHAPYDYLALQDLKGVDLSRYGITGDMSQIPLIPLIKVPEYGLYPAVDAVKELGVRNQNDPKAEEATKLVYRREFHGGVLTETTGKYAGTKVSKIKEVLTRDLIEQGIADVLHEFSEQPVICRCGTSCVVKLVEDQWFLKYSDPAWKGDVYRCLGGMQMIPEEMRVDFENKVDWLRDKACARRKGLGTNLPWDPQWLIESLGDSTIYMAYYILAKFLGGLQPDQLKKEFFDYVLLGEGSCEDVARTTGIKKEEIEEIRKEFEYWYPVDLRSSGKDLIPNHLLFYLYHHVAIFPEDKWPKALAINGFVSLEGKKMSKSKGPLLTLKWAVEEYGADITRLYILSTAEHVQDADWRSKDVDATKKQVERFYRMAMDAAKAGGATLPSTPQEPCGEGELKLIDRWMLSKLQSRISETLDALNSIQTRRAVQNAFYLLMNDIKWYERRGGSKVRREVFKTWIKLLAPFIPHLCEEIWQEFEDSYVSLAPYPTPDLSLLDKEGELGEELITATLRDVDEIIRLTKIAPKKVVLYTSHQWKIKILKKAIEMKKSGSLQMKTLMEAIMGDPSIREHAKEAPKFAQRILTDIQGMGEALIKLPYEVELDEMVILREAKPFLEKEIGCRVEVYSADNPAYDPKEKSRQAAPMRPAIYIE